MQLYDIIRTQPVAFPAQPETSQGAKDLISRLLHKDPDQRATMQEAMRHGWTEFGSTRPLRCQQVRPPGQAHSVVASWPGWLPARPQESVPSMSAGACPGLAAAACVECAGTLAGCS